MLRAYAVFNHKVGYCQGISYVAAMFLCQEGVAEEEAFWMLMQLMSVPTFPQLPFSHTSAQAPYPTLLKAVRLPALFLAVTAQRCRRGRRCCRGPGDCTVVVVVSTVARVPMCHR